MENVVYQYLVKLRNKAEETYAFFDAFYSGNDQERLAMKREREQLISNVIFDGEYSTPVLKSGEQESEFDNSVQFYAIAIYEKLQAYAQSFFGRDEPLNSKTALGTIKIINDLRQILRILRLHFTMVHSNGYSSESIQYFGAQDEEILFCGFLTLSDPRYWRYLPSLVVEEYLLWSYNLEVDRAVIPAYDGADFEGWLRHFERTFRDYRTDVFFSNQGFESFQEFLKNSPKIKFPMINHYELDKSLHDDKNPKTTCMAIMFDYYVGHNTYVSFKLLFDLWEDGKTWRLAGYQRDDEVGYSVEAAFDQSWLFQDFKMMKRRWKLINSIVYFNK